MYSKSKDSRSNMVVYTVSFNKQALPPTVQLVFLQYLYNLILWSFFIGYTQYTLHTQSTLVDQFTIYFWKSTGKNLVR